MSFFQWLYKPAEGKPRYVRWLYIAFVWFLISTNVAALSLRFVPVYLTPLMVIRSVAHITESKFNTRKKWVPIERISKNMVRAAIASEDQRFEDHFGFDFKAIENAAEHNERQEKRPARKRRLLGASTISQQTAKNVFLVPYRSYVRKAFEVYFTLLIEAWWGKERIMEVYLNVAEFGRGIYGIEAASLNFFDKHAYQLSKAEAAALAAVLPSPMKFNPEKASPYLQKRQRAILRQMSYLAKTELNSN